MSVSAVAGVNWGDEGKGRMVDYLARDADFVVRFQGGNNAGHTVVNEFGTFKLHLVPSGVFYPTVLNILGPGMAVDIEALEDELQSLRSQGIGAENVRVSDRATICFPFYRDEDEWEEERLGEHAYGSTRRGIAPAYGDRYRKKAVQVGELLYPDLLKPRLQEIVRWKNATLQGITGRKESVSFADAWEWVVTFGERIKPLIADTSGLLAEAGDKNILFEAQLGALRDVTYGAYPYTSSSTCLSSFAGIGGGLFGRPVGCVVGVMKAFSTLVGAAPFVTEMADEEADQLREIADEYGAATCRPRRIGHFDAVASRYGARIQAVDHLALTKLDSLTGREKLSICTHYEWRGQVLSDFPLNAVLEECRPVYQEMPGWREEISDVRRFEELPASAQSYVLAIERLVEKPIRYISVGPEREQMIVRPV